LGVSWPEATNEALSVKATSNKMFEYLVRIMVSIIL
jgi:hypothetical protein